MSEEIYVVVAERAISPRWLEEGEDDGGGLVFETPIRASSMDDAKSRVARFDGDYGKCRIAKLVFIDEVAE